jgi:hypothetical protein
MLYVLILSRSWDSGYPDWDPSGFPQLFQADGAVVT